MASDSDLYILKQINTGLQIDMQQLQIIDAKIGTLLDEARTFPGASSCGMEQDWDILTANISKIRRHSEQIDAALLSNDTANPKEHFEAINKLDQQTETHFGRLQDAGATTVAPERKNQWNDLWKTIFLNLDMIRAHSAMVQSKGEMRVRYGKAKADGMAQEILGLLPSDAKLGESTRYAAEYRKAFDEYQEKKESFGGFFDVVKSLFMVSDELPDNVAKRRMNRVFKD